jgi:hypothetical protein
VDYTAAIDWNDFLLRKNNGTNVVAREVRESFKFSSAEVHHHIVHSFLSACDIHTSPGSIIRKT